MKVNVNRKGGVRGKGVEGRNSLCHFERSLFRLAARLDLTMFCLVDAGEISRFVEF